MHFSGLGLNIKRYVTLFTNLAHMVQMLLLWLFFLPSWLVSQAVTISAPIPALKQWAILDLYLSSLGYSCRSLASVGVEHPLVGVEHLLIGVELQLQGPCRGEVRWPDLYLGVIVLTRELGWGTCSTAWCSIAFALHRGFPWQWHHHWVTSPSFSFPGLSSCQLCFQAGNFKLTGQPSVCW